MEDQLKEAKELFEKHDLASSLEAVNKQLTGDKQYVEALLLRARIQYKMQRWGDAINDFNTVLEIDPTNREAISGLEMAKSILGYFTPDMFNP